MTVNEATGVTGLPSVRCRDCGVRVLRVVLTSGRLVLIDPDPSLSGTVVRGGDWCGRPRFLVLTGDELPAQAPAWTRHEATCRAGRLARGRSGRVLCAKCGGPLDPDVVAAEPWFSTHPSCDPLA